MQLNHRLPRTSRPGPRAARTGTLLGATLLSTLALAAGTALQVSAQEFKRSAEPMAAPPGTGIETLRSPDMRDPTNAALRHYRAWTMARTEDLSEFDTLWSAESELKPGWKPSAALRQSIAKLSDYAELSLQASRLKDADWGVEYSDGFMALLPHLGLLRREARVLEMRARVGLADVGAERAAARADAARDLAACFRIAQHPASDRVLISTLVSGAIAGRAAAVVTFLIDQGELTAAEAPVLLEAARSLDARDPFNLDGALRGELWLAASAFARTGPDAGKQAAKMAREALGMQQVDGAKAGLVESIEAMDESGLRQDVLKHQKFFDEARRLVRSPGTDTAGALEQLEKRVAAGEFGLTLQLTAPSVATGYRNARKQQDALAALITRLEALK